METKICCRCGNEKLIFQFSKCKNAKDGFKPACKECLKINNKKYKEEKKEKIKESSKKYYLNNYEIINIKNKKYLEENSENRKEYKKKYYNNHKYNYIENQRVYRKKNSDKIRIYRRKYKAKRYYNDQIYKITVCVRSRIRSILKLKQISKKYNTFDLIGCSPEGLKIHLEKQFTIGMTWKNYGQYGWHIDHIIPLDSGKTEKEIYKLCHYTNLQPLWWKDNLSKGAKLPNII
jgi:hypothetical protein